MICVDVKMIKMRRCKGEKMICVDVRMRRCEGEKMICEDEKMICVRCEKMTKT